MKVMKFGGSSLGSPESMIRCAELVEREISLSGKKPLVVVSAYGKNKNAPTKITDLLLNAAANSVKGDFEGPHREVVKRHVGMIEGLKLPADVGMRNLDELHDLLNGIHMVKEITPRLYDYVASFGERLASKCFAALLRARGHESAEAFNAYDLGFRTDSNFMNARPLPSTYDSIKKAFEPHARKLAVVTGFIGKDEHGEITTIGRSGSDFTASIFGAALKVEEIQIWTDVPGVLSSDPTLVKDARPLPKLSFEEAGELAYYGAEVLHPATMVPALKHGVAIRVLHTFDPDAPGTLIALESEQEGACPVKSIVYKEDQVLINVRSERMLGMEGFMARLFGIFERVGIVIDMISTSEVSVSLTTDCTDKKKLEELKAELLKIAKVDIQPEKCIVAVVGEGMKNTKGLAARTFKAVAEADVSLQMISQGASEINITVLIDNAEIPAVVQALHREFFPAS